MKILWNVQTCRIFVHCSLPTYAAVLFIPSFGGCVQEIMRWAPKEHNANHHYSCLTYSPHRLLSAIVPTNDCIFCTCGQHRISSYLPSFFFLLDCMSSWDTWQKIITAGNIDIGLRVWWMLVLWMDIMQVHASLLP